MMNNSDNTEYYDREGAKEEYEEFYSDDDFVKFPVADKRFVQALISRFDIEPEARVLDVACGTGKFSHYFQQYGADAIGIDITRNGVMTGTGRYPAVEFLICDAMTLPFEPESFDVVFCHGFPLFNEPDLEVARPYMNKTAEYLEDEGLFVFGKTTSLTDEPAPSGSRMDHSMKTFVDFFESLESFELVEASATVPHSFIPLGQFGFTSTVTTFSKLAATILNLPLRVYIILKKRPTHE